MTLPADAHVHSEWSWDTGGPASAAAGRMRATCARAVAIGLPALIFTEHLDFPRTWRSSPEALMPHQRGFIDPDGLVDHPRFDPDGYFEAIERMRREFPGLRILTGLEFSNPPRWEAAARELVDLGRFDRINGSVHMLDIGPAPAEPGTLYGELPPDDVVRAYLAAFPVMVDSAARFEVVTHIDYAARQWPTATAGPFDPRRFEGEFRAALRAIAESGRALELNTRRLWSWVPQWWVEEGGRAISFGSDAHLPEKLADNFPEAVLLAEHFGFRPGAAPEALWVS
ncbi:MAG: PHP domain-containing protein [Microbacteriaceae bacterium]|nr:PHP domain-containing protein [Microbacteriaceae bacterium]MCL2795525.1 PHP domain-containing protein [Microbacteriaceae bacterium]